MGQDGGTHQGVYDLAYLNCIPNLIIYAPSDEISLRNILYTAQLGLKHPIAIRYPRGRGIHIDWQLTFEKIEIGKGHCIQEGNNIAIISIGSILKNVLAAVEKSGQPFGVYDIGFLKPIDTDLLDKIFKTYNHIITVEDGSKIGGLGSVVGDYAFAKAYKGKLTVLGVPDTFIEHATVEEQYEEAGISLDAITRLLKNLA